MSIEAAEEISRGAGLAEMPAPSRGFVRQALHDTLGSRTARAGLGWLSLLLVFAVFGPIIANSHPLMMKSGGRWSSPMLHALTPSDVLVFLAFFTSAILAVGRWFSFPISLLIIIALVLLAAGPAFAWVHPPEDQDYSAWRTLAVEGKIESSVYSPIPYSPSDRLRDQVEARLLPPSRAHWLGTDGNGADIASNIIHASRVALSVGFMATGISVVIGILLGGVMGYYAGMLDLLGMRVIEVFEAIPRLFLLITITAFVEHRNIYLMMLVIGVTGWTGYARFLRGEFFTLRKLDYVQAGIAAGLPRRSILFRHMLPNGITPILVSTTFGVASAILYEAVLSFLGLGLVDEASWGALLNQARAGGLGFIWWIALFPGLAIFLTVFSYNLIGEAVRDALDPKLQKR